MKRRDRKQPHQELQTKQEQPGFYYLEHESERRWRVTERYLRRIARNLDFLLIYMLEVLPTKHEIRTIMSAISEYTATVQAQYGRINASLDNITSDLAGVKAKLEEMNQNPGPITPEDQELLNQSIASLTAIGDRAEALAASTEDAPAPPPA